MIKLDSLILEVGKGIMQQWLALLLPTIVGDSFAKEHARGKAIDDAAETQYDRRRDLDFWAGDLQIGTMVMYMTHVMLTTGHDSVDELADQLVPLFEMTQGGIPGSMYCRQAIQFAFAANRHVGKLNDRKSLTNEQMDSRPDIGGGSSRRQSEPSQVYDEGSQMRVREDEAPAVRD
jgi:hypothetical protein